MRKWFKYFLIALIPQVILLGLFMFFAVAEYLVYLVYMLPYALLSFLVPGPIRSSESRSRRSSFSCFFFRRQFTRQSSPFSLMPFACVMSAGDRTPQSLTFVRGRPI